jgi:hypothetical protein
LTRAERDGTAGVRNAELTAGLVLAAWGDGVGSNWTGFAGRNDDVRREFARTRRTSWPWSSLGFPNRKVIGRKKRKALEEVASVERFGRRLSG